MGKIVTFYSYKGGVGRTMALANIAVLLSQWKYKVLIIDWDLEAPGLENFFKDYFSDLNEIKKHEGLIDIINDVSSDSNDICNRWKKLVIEINIPNIKSTIDIITAGRRGDDYFNNFRKWDIQAFYDKRNGGQIIEILRDQWKEKYDFIFIDSRTGVTDIGGICTIQLPDILVLLFSANEQSFNGIIEIANRVIQEHKQLAITRYRPLLIPIPSRFDTQETLEISQAWLDRFSRDLAPIYSNWLQNSIDRKKFLEITKIPYSTSFSYGERLPVLEQGTNDPTGLGYAYENIATLIANDLYDVKLLLDDRSYFTFKAKSKDKITKNQIFISYHHKDERWKDRFKPHLAMLEKYGRLKYWDDRKIDTGASWYPEIQAAMEQATVAVLLISADYLSSDFCLKEEIPFLLERRTKQGMLIIPILIRPCHWKSIQWLKEIPMIPRDGKSVAVDYKDDYDTIFASVAEQIDNYQPLAFVEYEEPAAPSIHVQLRTPEEKIEIEAPPSIPVDIERLPVTGAELFGRQNELNLLDDAWESGDVNVISFVAWGGVGKSTLVNKWIERMAAEDYRSAKRVYAWSFYSQGTGERVTSADQFISHALKFFGDPDPAQGSPWDKGKRLASMIRADKTLLILVGLEPLQSDLRFEYGKIKDPALSVLVSELAKANHGLCVITSRVAIAEMQRYPSSVRQVDLEQISDEAGRALLRVRGVRGSDAELEGVTRAFGNHALAINLLAEYLHTIPEHPAQAAHQIPDLDTPEKEGKYPRRVMEAFTAQFGEGAELELLCVLGLFDRPAAKAAIDAVIQGESIKGLTTYLSQLSESDWLRLLQKLRDLKLIAHESKHRPDIVDCHPLIREHFGQKLKARGEKLWQEAHSRLYEYYKNLPKKELPDTLEEMEPLLAAVAHGCQAGKYQEAFDKIFFGRIGRNNDYYIVNKFGAFGSFLRILSNFFDEPWKNISRSLRESSQAVLLGNAGFGLRALGRLREAGQPMQAALENHIKLKNLIESARDAGNLSELYLTLGEVEVAVSYARQSVDLADRSGDDFQKYSKRTTLADALLQTGELSESEQLFKKAESMQKNHQPNYPYLYSLWGFWFCDLLMSQGKVGEVLKRAEQTLEWMKNDPHAPLLTIVLDYLSLGRAYLLEALTQPFIPPQGGEGKFPLRRAIKRDNFSEEGCFKQAADYLNQGVVGLREAGQQDYLPRGLFARALFYRIQNQFPQAWDDLEEAQELAERGDMKLHLVDYHLEAARVVSCQLSANSFQLFEEGREVTLSKEKMIERLKQHVGKADEQVKQTGYHRRDPEVELGYADLFFAQGDQDKAREHLGKAKALLDKMGIRCWDFEVRRLEQFIG